MKAVDFRLIFDEDEQEVVIGCHECEKTTSVPVIDIPRVATTTPEFCMEHLVSCGKKIS